MPAVMTFSSRPELVEWLLEKGIDISDWGTGGAKSVDNLWAEYVNNEIVLQDHPPLRIVQVVQVLIRRGNRILLEVEQELERSRRRFRNLPPSEKMKRGESYIDAAVRCLDEELDLTRDEIAFIGSSYRRTEQVTDSPSYPGLQTNYTFHCIGAIAEGLPSDDFWRENTTEGHGDPVKRHLWAWRRRD